MNNDHLEHHGILGQKWGVRRYRTKNGDLTPAGKRRLKKLKNQYKQLTGKEYSSNKSRNKNRTTNDILDNTPVRRLTNSQLQTKIKRLESEDRAQKLHYKMRASAGRKIVHTVGKEIITPALIDAGKNVLTRYLENTMYNTIGMDHNNSNNKKKNINKKNR